ncbi:MAG TPA: hypothetical protein VKS79_13410, partial [Gemmataceae bacterium]|nr:hypothetical protein [Gemmataceae bacterium]
MPRVAAEPPLVRLELRHGSARPTLLEVRGEEFLIGSVPGCDLRIPGSNLPPIICQIIRRTDGLRLKKLAPTLSILLNGQPVTGQSNLAHGDCIRIGAVELHVQLTLAEHAPARRQPAQPAPVSFVPIRIEASLPPTAQLAEPPIRFPQPEPKMDPLPPRASELFAEEQKELEMRRRKLDEQVKELEADRVLWYRRREEIERECKEQSAQLQQQRQQFEVEVQAFRLKNSDLATRLQQLEQREREWLQKNAVSQSEADKLKNQHVSDSLQLRQKQAELEQREKELQSRAGEIDRHHQHMQLDARELEEQARKVDVMSEQLRKEAERLAAQKQEQEATARQHTERASALDGQQAALVELRTRMERLRDEVREQDQRLANERARQEELATQLRERLQAIQKQQTELDTETHAREQDRASIEERSTALQNAINRVRQLQEKLEADQEQLQTRTRELDERAANQEEQTALMRARAEQLLQLQQRLDGDRQALQEREMAMTQAEEIRKTLQAQLLRRSEELAARAQDLEKHRDDLQAKEQDLEKLRQQVVDERNQWTEGLAAKQREIDARAAELDQWSSTLTQREENLGKHLERLKQEGQALTNDRGALNQQRALLENQHSMTVEQAQQARLELDNYRQEIIHQAAALLQQLPELELRGKGAIERLTQARDQMKGHLGEVHTYIQQGQEDLQALRGQVQAEAERLRQQELALQRARSEHRLAVTAFRQQLIDWQGRVGEMRQLFAQSESRLEIKQQAVAQAAKVVDDDARKLAEKTAALSQKQREVGARKTEVERHLGDMRDWYRHKLRELAIGSTPSRNYSGEVLELPAANGVNDPAGSSKSDKESRRETILSIVGELDPADRKLGELLLSLGLVEEEILVPLWNEARRQRRSLRQMLLSSGAITLYQLALIEAGNLDSLMIGSYRVVDRVQSTPRETLYRVFDPKRSTVALLRYLSEPEMSDAVHPDEYRQRFRSASTVQHPNLAAIYEVQEIAGRPAVLQEWVGGLPSSDWPPLAAAAGAWYRLLNQAALGMQAAQLGGLVHGHLTDHSVVLLADATVKLLGFGEPLWLHGLSEADATVAADIEALGRLASAWSLLAPRRKGSKPKPLPEALQTVLRRMGAEAYSGDAKGDELVMLPPFPEDDRYSTATELLEDLDQVGA